MQTFFTLEAGVYEYRCVHFSPQELADPCQIDLMILHDLQISGVRPRQLQNALVILNFLGEAINSTMARPLVTALRQRSAKIAGIFMVPDANTSDYESVVIPYWCANHCQWFTQFRRAYGSQYDLTVKTRLICLNRRRSAVRSKVVATITKLFEPDEILISHESIADLALRPDGHSLLLDGPVDQQRQHRVVPPGWLQAAVKVITEGNEQGCHNVPETVLVSEKTFKCFAWRQFPVWISVPGTAQMVRDMGFDVFDDLFDHHRYDLEPNQDRRMDMALDLAREFVSRPLHQLEAVRKRMTKRLQKNYQRLTQLADRQDRDLLAAQQQFIKMFAQNPDSSV